MASLVPPSFLDSNEQPGHTCNLGRPRWLNMAGCPKLCRVLKFGSEFHFQGPGLVDVAVMVLEYDKKRGWKDKFAIRVREKCAKRRKIGGPITCTQDLRGMFGRLFPHG